MREAASRFLPKHTAAADGNIGTLSHVELEGVIPMSKDHSQNKETSMAFWSAAWLWDWWRLKRVNAWLPSKRQAAFRGLVLVTLQSHSACKQNTQPSCRESPIFSWEDLKNSPELTIHIMPY